MFSCLSGQGRTTTAMVVAVLTFWHIRVREASCVRTGCLPRQGGRSVPGDTGCARRVWGVEIVPGWSHSPLSSVLGRGLADPWQGAPGMRERCSLGGVFPISAAVLPQGFPEVGEEELVSVPDAKFTMGEFEVSTPGGAPWGHLGEGRGQVLLAGLGGGLQALLHHMSASLFPFYR